MDVYLLQDILGKGKKGEIVKVSDGYAKNFLIPKKMAVAVTNEILAEKKTKDEANLYHKEQDLIKAKETAKFLDNKTVKISAKAGANGKLFGAITTKEIADLIEKTYDIKIDKRKIESQEIKTFGQFLIKLKIAVGVVANMKVFVAEES